MGALPLPQAARGRLLKEAGWLEMIPSASPEMGMVRTWIDWILDLPWGTPTAETIDIESTGAILDEDHFGLRKVKDRILEWLAVRQRIEARTTKPNRKAKTMQKGKPPARLKTPILCL